MENFTATFLNPDGNQKLGRVDKGDSHRREALIQGCSLGAGLDSRIDG
jgi:hypothetical protein